MQSIGVGSLTQCDEMKIFGQNLKILSNRIIWAPIDREKSIFEKKMSRSPFLTTQNTSFSKIHNFCKVQLFSKRFSDYDREFPVLFYKNKKIIFGRPEDSLFLTCHMEIDFWKGTTCTIFLARGSKNRS